MSDQKKTPPTTEPQGTVNVLTARGFEEMGVWVVEVTVTSSAGGGEAPEGPPTAKAYKDGNVTGDEASLDETSPGSGRFSGRIENCSEKPNTAIATRTFIPDNNGEPYAVHKEKSVDYSEDCEAKS